MICLIIIVSIHFQLPLIEVQKRKFLRCFLPAIGGTKIHEYVSKKNKNKLLLSYSDKFLLDPRKSKKNDEQSVLKWSSTTTVLLLLLLHKKTQTTTGQISLKKIVAYTEKKTNLLMAKKFMGKLLTKVRSPVLPDFWISETTKFFRKRSNWSGFWSFTGDLPTAAHLPMCRA